MIMSFYVEVGLLLSYVGKRTNQADKLVYHGNNSTLSGKGPGTSDAAPMSVESEHGCPHTKTTVCVDEATIKNKRAFLIVCISTLLTSVFLGGLYANPTDFYMYVDRFYAERRFIPFLNGNNGEATNTDDLDNAERLRNRREARNHRHQRNPGARNNGPSFQALSQELKNARSALQQAVNSADPEVILYRANVEHIMQEIAQKFPDRFAAIQRLPEIVAQNDVHLEVPMQVDDTMVRKRVYICSPKTDESASSLKEAYGYISIAIVVYLAHQYGINAQLVFALSSLSCVTWFALHRFLFYRHGQGGITPEFIGDSNAVVMDDPTFIEMEVQKGTFWSLKGYTHYVDIDLPRVFFSEHIGSAKQVVSGITTDSQLVPIAFSTMMRDSVIREKVEGMDLARSYEFNARYASIWIAQQHMYHLYQTQLMSGRLGKLTMPGWEGSEINFRYGGRIHGHIKIGIFRQYFEQSQSKDIWIDNGRFTVVSCVHQGRLIRLRCTPLEWLETIGFTEVDHINQKRLQRYRTKLLTFHNGGVLYARTNVNLLSALNRMFTCRENKEYEENLRRLQYKNLRIGARRVGKILGQISEIVKSKFDRNVEIDDLLGQLRIIEENHPKKELRKQAHEYIVNFGKLVEASYASKVTAKVKIEVAKFMKNARVYVDMTTPQSLLGGWLIDPLKNAMKDVDLGWCRFIFVKTTDEETVHAAFQAMRDEWHRPLCVYHSDDAVMQLPCSDGILRFNLDISSCDRSNMRPLFDYLLCMIPEGPWKFIYERMIQGCSLPLVIPNPSGFGEYVKVKPTEPFEYSGCNLTTVLNNCALLAIASSIFHKFRRKNTKERTMRQIPKSAESVGYKVTVQECKRIEQIQFLKFSPSCEQYWYPVRNLGCILRAVGHFDGDLPGSGNLENRAMIHVAQVVTGITTGYIDPVASVLRRRFNCSNPISNKYQWGVAKYSEVVTVQHLINRYSLTDYEVAMLFELVNTCNIGDYVTSPVLSRIFTLDYG